MSSPDPALAGFTDPLPDSRIVSNGVVTVALVGPSDRYAHGVLGDELEATGLGILDADGPRTTIKIDEPDVIEAVSPMLADVDGDGTDEIVVTLSNADDGARLAAYSVAGELVAETAAIGQGNRWRNLLAVAPIGPNGEIEVIDVRTPHIGGTLQFFQFDASSGGPQLRRVAAIEQYSTHTIGSRNLDLGIVADGDGDDALDVVLPTQDLRSLAVVSRTDDDPSGAIEVGRVALGDRLTTNVAASAFGTDIVSFAVGTADGRLLVWPDPKAPASAP